MRSGDSSAAIDAVAERAAFSLSARAAEPARAATPANASGPSTAFQSTCCIPTVQARKFGSVEERITLPAPTGSSTTAAVPPSSSSPRAKPETAKSGLAAAG
jgi:hypothetical protein